MSGKGVLEGPGLAVLITILGVVGFLIAPLALLVFIVLLGYELYKIEKRLAEREASPADRPQPGKKPAK